MLTTPDSELYPVVTTEDWVFITNNERDFIKLAEREQLHPGLILLPQGTVAQQQQWFAEVIEYIEKRAADDGETLADWMVMRVVAYNDQTATINDGWLPDPNS